jgi:hypothetical protein
MVADFSDVQIIIGTCILLVPSANYEVIIVTRPFEREARSVLIQQKAISKEWFESSIRE